MSGWTRLKRIESADRRRWIDIETRARGDARFVETHILVENGVDYPSLQHFSGLYVDAEAAETDARLMLPWLCATE